MLLCIIPLPVAHIVGKLGNRIHFLHKNSDLSLYSGRLKVDGWCRDCFRLLPCPGAGALTEMASAAFGLVPEGEAATELPQQWWLGWKEHWVTGLPLPRARGCWPQEDWGLPRGRALPQHGWRWLLGAGLACWRRHGGSCWLWWQPAVCVTERGRPASCFALFNLC